MVVSLFRHIDDRDWNRVARVFCEDVVYERPGYPSFLGRARVMRFYRRERVIACGRHDLERIVVHGDAGACWGRFQGRQKDGQPVDLRFADVYEFAGGLIRHRTSYFFVPAV